MVCLGVGLGFILNAAQAPSTPKPAPGDSKPAAADKPGPKIPAGTGGPGGTSQADRARKFLAIGDAPDPAAVERGKTTFIATCGFCHGSNAKGGESGPDLLRSVYVLRDKNGDQIGPIIHQGRPGKGMPAFASMTQSQISDISAFLISRYQAAANRGSYEIQNVVTGDAKAGEAYFNGPGKCNTCHSGTGDLAGIAKKYEPDALQSRFLYPAPHGRGENAKPSPRAQAKATVTLPTGEAVSGVLEHYDDFSVSLVDGDGMLRSWPLDAESKIKVDVQDPLAEHAALLKKYTNTDMHNLLAYLETLK